MSTGLDETEVAYERCRTDRDNAEFLLAGQKPPSAATAAQGRLRVCVPANLVENHSWNIPPPGGKMEAFKNFVRKIVRDEARSKGLDDPLFWVVEQWAHGSADLFDTFDPATTDPRRLVMFGGAGSGAHCAIGSYELKLQINP